MHPADSARSRSLRRPKDGQARSPGSRQILVLLILVVMLGCGDSLDSGAGGSGGRGDDTPREVESVSIDSASLDGTRMGQRWALTATALDAFDEPISDVDFSWESSDVSVADVNANGLLTALRPGLARITATASGHSDSIDMTSNSAVPSDVGEMFTIWFARSDDAPVAIVDGKLEVFTIYPGAAQATTPWPYSGVDSFEWAGGRLAILTDVVDGSGTLRVLDRHSEWSTLRVGDVMGVQLEGDRIAELGVGGSLRVKDGMDGPWTTLVSSGVVHFLLDGNRIAVLEEGGLLRAKDGIDGEWTVLAEEGVWAFNLHGDRIAAIFDAGPDELRIKDGMDGAWETLGTYAKKVVLSGDRIGLLRDDGVARVKDGIDGEWKQLASSYVADLQLAGDLIVMLFEGGDLRAKADVDGPWTALASDASRFVLQEEYIGMVSKEGELRFRIGLDGPWSAVRPAGTVSQFVPVADVPVPPARTTAADYTGPRNPCAGIGGHWWHCPASYAEGQQRCARDGARCEPGMEHDAPLPRYGRFCGDGRPLGSDWNWALGPGGGPMDAFDALCMHHQHASRWYPEGQSDPFDPCVIRYGLTYARVTRNGDVIEPGSQMYDEIMAKMSNLRDAIEGYAAYSMSCPPEQFEEFMEATRADH